jgi:RNA polymerase sigma factor (sigma-70 family)
MTMAGSSREAEYDSAYSARFLQLTRFAAMLGLADPEDTAQEALCRSRRRLSGLRDPAAVDAYLRRAIVNAGRTQSRRNQLARLFGGISNLVPSAEDVVSQSSEHAQMRTWIMELSQRQREVIILRYWWDLHEADIARELGISTGSVKTHSSRAMKTLADKRRAEQC